MDYVRSTGTRHRNPSPLAARARWKIGGLRAGLSIEPDGRHDLAHGCRADSAERKCPMRNHLLTSIILLVLSIAPAAGQTTKEAPTKTTPGVKPTWSPPRTPDGQPDLQGAWTNNTVTPLQRP